MHMSIRILLDFRKITSHRNQNHLSHPSLSHIEQECQESLIQEKIHIKKNSNKGLKFS